MCRSSVFSMGEESDNVAAAALPVEGIRSERKRPPPPKAAPWLVIPYGKGNRKNQAFYNICEPNNKTLRKSIPEMNGKTFKQKTSHQGWCIMLCDEDDFDYSTQVWNFGDCFLWNPATLQTIELPSLLYWMDRSEEYVYQDCVLSSAPSCCGETDNNNSMVLFLFGRKDERYDHVLLYCFPGDKQWRTQTVARDMVDFEDVLSIWCFKEKFYVMCVGDRHLEIERQNLGDIITFSIRPIEVADTILWTSVGGRDTTFCSTQFVECGDELYKIVTTYPARGYHRVDIALSVSKFDFSVLELKEVNSFGDHVLFLSNVNCVSCSATELGLSKGCLYYTVDDDQSLHKFEVESNGNSVLLPCLKIPATWYTSGWIMVHDKHRRKEDMLGNNGELNAVLANKTSRTGSDENEDQRETHSRQEPHEAIPWDILNQDMVGLIAKNYLHRLDYIHFRLVSKANRAVMPMVKLTSTCTARNTNLSPWLVYSRDKCSNGYNFVNPMHENENYLMNLPDLGGATIRFQKGGWLLMSKGLTSIFFYNPFAKVSISLPDLPVDMYSFSGITFSSAPTSSDCTVFAIQQMPASDGMSNEISIYFINRGAASWNLCYFPSPSSEKFMPLHNTPVFHNGVFYCVDYNGTLGVFNLEDCSWKVIEKPHHQFNGIYPSFLVECAGQILLVKLGHLGASVGVFRLDFSKMVWSEVRNLGRHMLFISYTSCFSAIAPKKRMENKIYFPRLCLNGEGVLFYSLETGNYHSFGIQHSANNFYDTEGWYTNCTWIEPNWSKAEELDWLNPLL